MTPNRNHMPLYKVDLLQGVLQANWIRSIWLVWSVPRLVYSIDVLKRPNHTAFSQSWSCLSLSFCWASLHSPRYLITEHI